MSISTVQTEMISAEAARKQANVWLLENVGNLLRAESPELVLMDKPVWRVAVSLTSPNLGSVGCVGNLELDAVSGEVLDSERVMAELHTNTYSLASD
jgi:hypothetical protein